MADWIIHCIENRIVGVFNVTGPERELSMQGMVEGVRQGVGSDVSFVWVASRFLEAQGISEGRFPLYVPPTGENAGFHRLSFERARARGLQYRPLPATAKATLDWYRSLPANIQAGVAPQFARHSGEEAWLDTEKRLLDAWAK